MLVTACTFSWLLIWVSNKVGLCRSVLDQSFKIIYIFYLFICLFLSFIYFAQMGRRGEGTKGLITRARCQEYYSNPSVVVVCFLGMQRNVGHVVWVSCLTSHLILHQSPRCWCTHIWAQRLFGRHWGGQFQNQSIMIQPAWQATHLPLKIFQFEQPEIHSACRVFYSCQRTRMIAVDSMHVLQPQQQQ